MRKLTFIFICFIFADIQAITFIDVDLYSTESVDSGLEETCSKLRKCQENEKTLYYNMKLKYFFKKNIDHRNIEATNIQNEILSNPKLVKGITRVFRYTFKSTDQTTEEIHAEMWQEAKRNIANDYMLLASREEVMIKYEKDKIIALQDPDSKLSPVVFFCSRLKEPAVPYQPTQPALKVSENEYWSIRDWELIENSQSNSITDCINNGKVPIFIDSPENTDFKPEFDPEKFEVFTKDSPAMDKFQTRVTYRKLTSTLQFYQVNIRYCLQKFKRIFM
jgi:hypothetical protein